MSILKFYNQFHIKAKGQFKIIDQKNITYRIILSELNSLKVTNLNILDYGCGVGTLSFYFASKNNKVTGVDVSDLAIKLAKKSADNLKLKQNCIFYTLKKFNKITQMKKYDLIICSEVIEHVHDDKQLIRILSKLLKKSGYLLITTPSINAPLYKIGMLNKFDKEVGHLRRYDLNNLKNLLLKNGFKLVLFKKTEGIARNFLYTSKSFGFLLKFLKGPLSDMFTFIDDLLIPLFGESNIHILSQKIS